MKITSLCRSLLHFNEARYLFAVNPSGIYSTPSRCNKISQRLCTNVSTPEEIASKESSKKLVVSKAMKAYLQRSVEHEKFLSAKMTEYEIGKRHLANMMGENPDTFTQEDVDQAIAYLLPSGLFEPRARPKMKPPSEVFLKRKEAEFDETGRPHHSLFYTGRPAYYSLLQEVAIKSEYLNQLEAKSKGSKTSQVTFEGSKWIRNKDLEEMLTDSIPDYLYDHFIQAMERLISHPMANSGKDFIMKFRQEVSTKMNAESIPQLMYTAEEVPYMTALGTRKTCTANVTVYGKGSGKFTVNGEDILYFNSLQDREQIMFPLQLSGLMRAVDVEATVEGGGNSGQAGALRYGISLALRSFVPENMIERMRIAGLLTKDARKKERNKPGRRRARAKYTWKKR